VSLGAIPATVILLVLMPGFQACSAKMGGMRQVPAGRDAGVLWNVKLGWASEGKPQRAKVSVRVWEGRTAWTLVDPLGRPWFQVWTEAGEEIHVAHLRRKKVWMGPFRELSLFLWGASISHRTFLALLEGHLAPRDCEALAEGRVIRFSRDDEGHLAHLIWSPPRMAGVWTVDVIKRSPWAQPLNRPGWLGRFASGTLEEVLAP